MKLHSEGFPSIAQAILLLLANFLLCTLAAIVLQIFQKPLGLNQAQLNALASVLGSGILLAHTVHRRKLTYADLLHPGPSSVVATAALLVPAVLLLVPMMLLANIGLMAFLESMWPLSAWEQQLFALMADDSFSNLLWICVLAPVLEEILFRGILLRALLQRHARWLAISASAFLFGVAHLNVYQFALAFLLGLPLGWLYERSRSLIPCIALHAAMNTASVMADLSVPTGTEFQLSDVPVWAWALSAAAAVLATRYLLRVLGSEPAAAN